MSRNQLKVLKVIRDDRSAGRTFPDTMAIADRTGLSRAIVHRILIDLSLQGYVRIKRRTKWGASMRYDWTYGMTE